MARSAIEQSHFLVYYNITSAFASSKVSCDHVCFPSSQIKQDLRHCFPAIFSRQSAVEAKEIHSFKDKYLTFVDRCGVYARGRTLIRKCTCFELVFAQST